ncbi:hypothetical protein [Mycolicibacterium baixiangningiae]|uniref:hypothetical protein n=1 Tax=Mycolicibacterium baixiangningiae TaxID=2761578 RepID=UPI0018D021BA|nr:hypothetical protein [Mycolicibacterium baixiangningiae]
MGDQQPTIEGWRKRWAAWKGSLALTFGVVTVALTITVLAQAIEILQPHTKVLWGSISEALAAIGTLLAVGVALWQSVVIRRQAQEDAREAAGRLQRELDAANERTRQEVEAAEERSRRDLLAADERHRAELESHQALSNLQHHVQRQQERKQAIADIGRAVYLQQHILTELHVRLPQLRSHWDDNVRVNSFDATAEQAGRALAEIVVALNSATSLFSDEEPFLEVRDRVAEAAGALRGAERQMRQSIVTPRIPFDADKYQRAQDNLTNAMSDLWDLARIEHAPNRHREVDG